MGLVQGCEISEQIANKGKYSEEDAQVIFKQILEGLAYLHKERVCHRDIKPSNILITQDKQVKIADFNVSKDLREAQQTEDISMQGFEYDDESFKMLTRGAGTLAFMAPERLTENAWYSEKVDLWSAGIVLIMMLTGGNPFNTGNT